MHQAMYKNQSVKTKWVFDLWKYGDKKLFQTMNKNIIPERTVDAYVARSDILEGLLETEAK